MPPVGHFMHYTKLLFLLPIVPGVHSSTPLGGIARRFSNDFATGSRANLIINQNGEPELVADLM